MIILDYLNHMNQKSNDYKSCTSFHKVLDSLYAIRTSGLVIRCVIIIAITKNANYTAWCNAVIKFPDQVCQLSL